MHGDLGQLAREKRLKAFRTGASTYWRPPMAARGRHRRRYPRINYQCPEDEKMYAIGRTGRGRTGVVVTLVPGRAAPLEHEDRPSTRACSPDPAVTYSNSPHLYAELAWPMAGGTSRLARKSQVTPTATPEVRTARPQYPQAHGAPAQVNPSPDTGTNPISSPPAATPLAPGSGTASTVRCCVRLRSGNGEAARRRRRRRRRPTYQDGFRRVRPAHRMVKTGVLHHTDIAAAATIAVVVGRGRVVDLVDAIARHHQPAGGGCGAHPGSRLARSRPRSSSASPATRVPVVVGGTVLTGDGRQDGRDPATGESLWSYARDTDLWVTWVYHYAVAGLSVRPGLRSGRTIDGSTVAGSARSGYADPRVSFSDGTGVGRGHAPGIIPGHGPMLPTARSRPGETVEPRPVVRCTLVGGVSQLGGRIGASA